MPKLYCSCLYKLDGIEKYLLWYSDDPDGIYIEPTGEIFAFSSLTQLKFYAKLNHLPLASEPSMLHDLDYIDTFIQNQNRIQIDYDKLLTAWNLFSDLAVSVPEKGTDFTVINKSLDSIYEIIVFRYFEPDQYTFDKQDSPWGDEENQSICKLMRSGIKLFRTALTVYGE